jgi:membrane protein implicated in regulation of membrane protease activity
MRGMRRNLFITAVGIFVLVGAAVSAWMLVPMSGRPLGSLSASQGDRVIWGWALATLVFGMACVWLILVLHRVIHRADQRAALRRTAGQSR